MKALKGWVGWVVMAAVLAGAFAVGIARADDPRTQTERIDAIAKTLKCPRCIGESVYESKDASAEAVRTEIARQVAAGRTDDEIRASIARSFDDDILLVPPRTGWSSLVWALPVMALVLSAGGLIWAFRRWRSQTGDAAAHLTDEDRDLVAAALAAEQASAHPVPASAQEPDVPVKLDPDRLAELEEERVFLLQSLADLERERAAGDLDDADYAELRDGYTARAAAVLRELDQGRPIASPAPTRSRRTRTVMVAGAVVIVAIAAGIAVALSSGQRLPGGTATGDTADTVNSLLAEARALQTTDPQAAIERYDQVLDLQPDDAEALTYRGWLLVQVGATAIERGLEQGRDLVERGEASMDRAIAADPSYADPYCFKAITRFRFYGDAAGAKAPVDTCLASNPPQVVAALVQNLQAEVDAALAAPTTPTSVAAVTTTGG